MTMENLTDDRNFGSFTGTYGPAYSSIHGSTDFSSHTGGTGAISGGAGGAFGSGSGAIPTGTFTQPASTNNYYALNQPTNATYRPETVGSHWMPQPAQQRPSYQTAQYTQGMPMQGTLGWQGQQGMDASQGLVDMARWRMNDWQQNGMRYVTDTMGNTINSANAYSGRALGQAQRHDENFWNNIAPFEQAAMDKARYFGSEGYKRDQVGLARTDAQQQFGNAEQQRIRQQQRMGVNPYSARAMGDQNAMEIQKAMALESAATKTRLAADQIGLDASLGTLDAMRGAAGRSNDAINAGTGAMNAGTNALNTGYSLDNANYQNVMGAWQAGANALNVADRDRNDFRNTTQRNANDYNMGMRGQTLDYNLGMQNSANTYNVGMQNAANNYNTSMYGDTLNYNRGMYGDQLNYNRGVRADTLNHNLGLFQGMNSYNASIFGSRTAANTARRGQNQDMFGTVLGGLFRGGMALATGGASEIGYALAG